MSAIPPAGHQPSYIPVVPPTPVARPADGDGDHDNSPAASAGRQPSRVLDTTA